MTKPDRAARVARALDKAKVPATSQVAVWHLVEREVKRAVEEEREAEANATLAWIGTIYGKHVYVDGPLDGRTRELITGYLNAGGLMNTDGKALLAAKRSERTAAIRARK